MPVNKTIHDAFMATRSGIARMLSRLVPPKEVDDILQDTYVRLCQAKSTDHIREPRSFMYRTARNLAYDHLKRAEVRLVDSDADTEAYQISQLQYDSDEPRQQSASQEEFGHFCDAVKALPMQCRRAFVLKKVYGYSIKEIATELAISEKTVEKHIAQGIKRCTLYMRKVGATTDSAENRGHHG
ncbi:RNA polymerase sigma factor [Salinimonas sediminis]|uniref:Sigma-70 family RNA polymerase sigma factor n=1 Tax=Salinimonas sediminis TaxID=2303538 RepID=A0A346NIY7_9ALTE|nr:sigma-70 family RNA polymerase sigma factor [Salinimonas sediminis]AXR05494.1 sigma-70 family RNA polymerase sigma factor [Salinimonas sediminis]